MRNIELYSLLNLNTFFTSGPEESRAWTIKKGSLAPEAAGTIHTDFQKGFIRAEAVSYEDFINNIIELLGNSERLEDMGRNSLIASGYAQQRADEASINLIELLKTYRKINVA